MKALTYQDWEETLNAHQLVLVDFFAPWCGPCALMRPVLEGAEADYPAVLFASVNVDEEEDLAVENDISLLPTPVLYRGGEESIGALSVVFRTQSAALIQAMTEFFRLWKRIEDAHLYPLTGVRIEYALYDGKFVRSLAAPERDCSTDELASALSEYIKLFDKLMKGYLTGRLDAHEVEAAYFSHMRSALVHV